MKLEFKWAEGGRAFTVGVAPARRMEDGSMQLQSNVLVRLTHEQQLMPLMDRDMLIRQTIDAANLAILSMSPTPLPAIGVAT
jgi:hypothetical protein